LVYWLPATLLLLHRISHSWCTGFPPLSCYCTGDHTVVVLSYTAQITLSSVKLLVVSFINCGNCFHVLENEISFSHLISFILPNRVWIILKMTSHTFHDFGNKFTFLLPVFHKSAGPHRCFALMTDLDVQDSFISPN
jgi:hypothetical protein